MANYLYNGVELPALPEWDKEAYPYAYIACLNGTQYFLKIFSEQQTVGDGGFMLMSSPNLYKLTDGEWASFSSLGAGGTLIWCNVDAYYNTGDAVDEELRGTLFLAASDPIPVDGEPETSEALPVSPYLRKNGSWQKQDTYKRVGGKWVKQTQKGYEMVESVWQPIFEKVEEPAGEPIAYLYNGVQLPDINTVWTDKETYPYAMLCLANNLIPGLVITTFPFKYNYDSQTESTNPQFAPQVYDTGGYASATYLYAENEEMVEMIKQTFGVSVKVNEYTLVTERTYADDLGGVQFGGVPFWSSFNIPYKDGTTIYLAASDPVPVYA